MLDEVREVIEATVGNDVGNLTQVGGTDCAMANVAGGRACALGVPRTCPESWGDCCVTVILHYTANW